MQPALLVQEDEAGGGTGRAGGMAKATSQPWWPWGSAGATHPASPREGSASAQGAELEGRKKNREKAVWSYLLLVFSPSPSYLLLVFSPSPR